MNKGLSLVNLSELFLLKMQSFLTELMFFTSLCNPPIICREHLTKNKKIKINQEWQLALYCFSFPH